MTLLTRTALLSTTMAFLATASLGATSTTTHSTKSATSTQQAQDSANGSVTDTDLTGNVDQDTPAITDQTKTSKKKVKKSHGKKKTMEKESESTTKSDSSSAYESVDEPTTTQGITPNDRVGSGKALDQKSN